MRVLLSRRLSFAFSSPGPHPTPPSLSPSLPLPLLLFLFLFFIPPLAEPATKNREHTPTRQPSLYNFYILTTLEPSQTRRVLATMANDHDSPISQLLQSLGMTREDLNKRSDQMRQFLTADSVSSRVFEHANSASNATNSTNDTRSRSSLSRARSTSFLDASSAVSTPPRTPIKREPSESALPSLSSSSSRPLDTMEAVIERQRQARKEKRAHKKEQQQRELAAAAMAAGSYVGPHPPSPTPSSASRSQVRNYLIIITTHSFYLISFLPRSHRQRRRGWALLLLP